MAPSRVMGTGVLQWPSDEAASDVSRPRTAGMSPG